MRKYQIKERKKEHTQNRKNADARFASLRVSGQRYLHNNRGSRNRLCLLPLTCASVGLSVGVAYRYSVYTRLGKSSKRLLLRELRYFSAIQSKVPVGQEARKEESRVNRNTFATITFYYFTWRFISNVNIKFLSIWRNFMMISHDLSHYLHNFYTYNTHIYFFKYII